MKKTLWRLGALAAGLLAGAPAAQAQQPAKAAPTAAELETFFDRLATSNEGEGSAYDSLKLMSRRLVAYLQAHEVTTHNLGVGLSAESAGSAHLKVFTYSYLSGGTRGTIHRPVLQWRNVAGQHFAYALQEECEFTDVYKLASPGRQLYLLLGRETANSYTELRVAYVLELKGDYLLLNNTAFGQGPMLSLSDVDMEFDGHKQQLYLTAVPNEPPPIPREIYVANKTPLSAWAQRGQRAPKAVTLKFSNGRFVRSR